MHSGTSLTDALRQWPTPRAEDSEQCGNHAGAIDSLTGALRQWPTPSAQIGDRGSQHPDERRAGGHMVNLQDAASHWPTPNVPNGGRSSSTSNYAEDGSKRQIDLGALASTWATPTARDYKDSAGMALEAVNPDGSIRTRDDQLGRQVMHWPTPTAEPYGSSQNGINGKGGAHERPSAATPSLERMSHSFRPDLPNSTRGDASSPSDPTSRPLWQTPHGIANTDQHGHTAGGGGEFHKQAMAFDPTPTTGAKAKLNPQFVEWLMGFPIGWTDCARAVTGLSRWKQRMRSSLWQRVRASGIA